MCTGPQPEQKLDADIMKLTRYPIFSRPAPRRYIHSAFVSFSDFPNYALKIVHVIQILDSDSFSKDLDQSCWSTARAPFMQNIAIQPETHQSRPKYCFIVCGVGLGLGIGNQRIPWMTELETKSKWVRAHGTTPSVCTMGQRATGDPATLR
jgi:hypothetical protein